MGEKRKIGIGFILTVLTMIVTAVSLFLYLQNCKTNYFANMGVDTIPVVCGILTAVAAIQFIGSRIAGAASIMTFESNAENMADLNNAIVAMACCVIALLLVMISSFFKVVKEA